MLRELHLHDTGLGPALVMVNLVLVLSTITVYNGDIEQSIRSLRKLMQREGTFKKFKERKFFADAVTVRRRKKTESTRRIVRKRRMADAASEN